MGAGGGSWTQKTRRDSAFFVFAGWRHCGHRAGGVPRGGRVLTRRGGGGGMSYIFGREWEVGKVGGGPRHEKHACVFRVVGGGCGSGHENAPVWARFLCFLCSKQEGKGGEC